ncbi:deoxyribose-phosphate aldolase/phospho-2-dehydro-3-deoxyheptonate aldolase [Fibrisoma limi BUZ 3]|uniref:Deoxyribose-phosphate aldolase/phospho-2-dehydro-3-deoxyheptonate aldolase n=1 Tax=Fibrisoma limi BUZ 3 TaxID=1185876 RepID=I2GC79_9BACT|nr:deoxyribose-phosphate aldolase [Fibrisoma limi]CCH51503.1 deoxyribose-phosphate aldolase/phospho-2-dehydro-3-deoxyheptonate aldolase [Fibrisoma limi BUZ 3]
MNHLFPYIERTLLHPGVTINEQYEALDEVTQLGLAGLTVAPFWVKKFRRELGDSHPAVLSTVVGYPYGYQRTEAKQTEVEWALKDGASEIEAVLNTSALFSPTFVWLKIELVKLIALAHAEEKLFTVILESSLLNRDQLVNMIKLAADAGADFIKNRTDADQTSRFSLDGALAFRQLVPSSVGVKIVVDGASESEMEQLVAADVERLALGSSLATLPNN